MMPKIQAAKAALLSELTEALRSVPNLRAVALGGSHARGTHTPQSDLDIGLYYRETQPFEVAEIRKIARRFAMKGEPIVTGFYEWGPFVNGGAWIVNAVCKIDFLYRNLDQLEHAVRDAQAGVLSHSFDQQPPFGFRSVTSLGEIRVCKPLYDPDDELGPLKKAVTFFPPKLKERIVRDMLWCAEFAFEHAHNYAASGDVPNTVGCMTRIYHYLVQTLFALNEAYFMNDKRVLTEIKGFSLKPDKFGARVSTILAAPGASPAAFAASLDALQSVFAETVMLADGAYKPKFIVP
jgi:predicted nucleotidyltransferase